MGSDRIENKKILLVLTDDILRALLAEALAARFPDTPCHIYQSGAEALQDIQTTDRHLEDHILVLLGRLADSSSDAFLEALDKIPLKTPIILLDHNLDTTIDHIPPQDRFSCPFRLGALLDRVKKHLNEKLPAPEHAIAIGPHTLKPARQRLIHAPDQAELHLTEKERDILLKLSSAAGKTVARQDLLDDVWGYVEGLETHTLETHIYRLRQKIETDPSQPEILLTDEQGYRLIAAPLN